MGNAGKNHARTNQNRMTITEALNNKNGG